MSTSKTHCMSNTNKHNTPQILIVAALAQESHPFVKMLESIKYLSHNCVVGSWNTFTVCVLTCGVGVRSSEALTAALLQQSSFECILNIGTCGALTNNLPVGTVCAVSSVHYRDAPAILIDRSTNCRLITVKRPIADPNIRAEHTSLADICDMEGYSIASVAQKFAPQTPLHLFKVVSDLAGKESDQALNVGGRADRVAHFKSRAKQLSSLRLLPHTQNWLVQNDGILF